MTQSTETLDIAEVEAFGGRIAAILNDAMTALMLSIGHRSRLFDTMARLDWASAGEIAAAARRHERYVREWLGAMVTSGVVDYDASGVNPGGAGGGGTRPPDCGEATERYRLRPEHAALVTRAAGAGNFAIFTQMIAVCAGVEDDIVACFEHGGGVPYDKFPRFHDVAGEYAAAAHDAGLLDVTLPMVPGLTERLEQGIRVADIGAGRGHAINVMAQRYPRSSFTAIDFAADPLAVGEREAQAMGLANATFLVQDAAMLDEHARYDFITTFDAVHDQADPLAMVRGVHRVLEPGGYWLCVDIGASSDLADNRAHPLGPFLYGLSCLHCMTVSLAYDGVGLGAMWGEQRALELFAAGGFADVTLIRRPDDPVNCYYVCRKADV